jgi:hypothetical protein
MRWETITEGVSVTQFSSIILFKLGQNFKMDIIVVSIKNLQFFKFRARIAGPPAFDIPKIRVGGCLSSLISFHSLKQ